MQQIPQGITAVKKKSILLSLVLIISVLLLIFSTSITAQNESSCVTCHTSETLLKLLCKVPAMPEGEGEG